MRCRILMDQNRPRSLFDELQRRREAPPPTLRWPMRIFHRPQSLRHGVAQSPEFRITNAVELHPKLKDRERNQLRGFLVGIGQQHRPALLERRKNRLRTSYQISHPRFLRNRACEVGSRRSSRLFHLSLPGDQILRKGAIGLVCRHVVQRAVGRSVARIRDLMIAMEQARPGEIFPLRSDKHGDRENRRVDETTELYDRGHGRPPNNGAAVGSTSILPDANHGMQSRTTKPASSTRSGCIPPDNLTA
jgi:hypothetical protein